MKKSLRKKAPTRGRSAPRPSPAAESSSSNLFPIVGIGASAGGLEAFSDLLHHLPEKTGMAFVLVQHLDPTHGSVLPEIRDRRFPRQNFRQDATMRWIQMLHQHKGHTGFFRQVMEEIGECFQASGRRADANDGKKLRAATLRRRTAS